MKKLLLVFVIGIALSGCSHLKPASFTGNPDTSPVLTAKQIRQELQLSTGIEHAPEPLSTRIDIASQQRIDSDKDGVFDYCDDCPNTPASVAADSFGCPIPLYVKTNLTFASNEVALDPMTQDKVYRLGSILKQNPKSMAIVAGHTDDVGDEANNVKLSQMRADSIKQLIVQEFGISPERIKAMGYGESQPLVSNLTESGRSRNRRVELTVTGYYRSETSYIALHHPYNIHYQPYQVDISGQFKARVDDLGAYLKEHPGTRALIDGYTDNSGETTVNLLLSQKRANAVKQYLIENHGIEEQRLTAIGHGENSPLASNDTEQGRNTNRRVTVTVNRFTAPRQSAPVTPGRFSGRLTGKGRLDTVSYTPLSQRIKIRFKADATDIQNDEMQTVNELGLLLQKQPDVKVTIEGYTQSQGPQGRDVQISRERAENIKRYLQSKYDISGERLRTIGYGAASPIAEASAENSVHIKLDHF